MARRCIASAPDWAKGHFRLGLALEAQQRVTEALAAYECARGIDPSSVALLACCARLAAPPPVGLAWVQGARVFTQHAYWVDLPASLATVAAFKAAHAAAAAGAGLSPAQVDAEQQLFDVPFIWGAMGPGGVDAVQLPPRASLLSSGVRFVVTAQPAGVVREVATCAARLRALPAADLEDAAHVADALAGLAPQTPPLLLCALLNAPERANVYVCSMAPDAAEGKVTVVASALRLDVGKLDAASRRMIAKPTPAEQCTSRAVCVWCGAAPVAEGVALLACPGCSCVAYCGAECRDLDRIAEHSLECGRSEDGKTQDGFVIRACTHVGATRAITEASKPESAKLSLPGCAAATGLEITRIACLTGLPEGSPQVLLVPGSWDVQPMGGRESGFR